MIESVTFMVKNMFADVKQYFDKEDLERFENDFNNLEELFEEQMKITYLKGYEDRWNINRTDLNDAFNDYFNTYRK